MNDSSGKMKISSSSLALYLCTETETLSIDFDFSLWKGEIWQRMALMLLEACCCCPYINFNLDYYTPHIHNTFDSNKTIKGSLPHSLFVSTGNWDLSEMT